MIFILMQTGCLRSERNTRTDIPFKKQGTVSIINSADDEIIFDVEIADDLWKRAQGLMFRYKLEANQGMFFIFDFQEQQSFWMKNTYLSLDMIFVDEDFIIVDIHPNAFPLSEEPIISEQPAMYVLEVLGGTARRMNIKVGDRVELRIKN